MSAKEMLRLTRNRMMDLLCTTLTEILPSPEMVEQSLEVKSLNIELRDRVRPCRLLLEWELKIDTEEGGSSHTGVSGRLSGVGVDGRPKASIRSLVRPYVLQKQGNAPSKYESNRSSSWSDNALSASENVLVLMESADNGTSRSPCVDNGMMALAESSLTKDAKLATDPLGK